MTKRWIIGIDGSLCSRTALEWALEQSERVGSELVVVHAYPMTITARAKALVGADDGHEGRGTAHALAELDAAVSDLVGSRRVERIVESGHPGRALLAAAEGADLIVVGRHGSGGGWHDTLGSISRYCVTHAGVPTVVVPTDWDRRPADRVVVGFDGSANAASAVRWALEFTPDDIEVAALIAIELAPWLSADLVRERLGDELAAEEERLVRRLSAIDPTGRTRPEVVIRDARPALADAACEADLVVVGQRGAGSLAPFVGGSVSTWMLDAAPKPVAVVPTAAA